WNYQHPTCRPPGSPESGGSGDGPLNQFSSGAVYHASASESDFALVEMEEPIPAEYRVFLAGWDRRDRAVSSGVAVHHPQAEEKRITFEHHPTTVTAYLSATPDPAGSYLRVADWDLGTTEGGSSGSPLFSPEKRIVGQLRGGFAACGNDEPDWYGRVARSMEVGLAPYLDPLGTGQGTLDGREAASALFATMHVTPTTVSPGETAVVSVEVTNASESALAAVAFANVLPGFLGYAGGLDASSGEAQAAGGEVRWTVDLAAGASATLAYTVAVAADAPGLPITNAATLDHPTLEEPYAFAAVVDVFVEPDFFYTADEAAALPDAGCPAMVARTIEVPDSFGFLAVKAGVMVEHTYRGDLRLQLVSPAGTVVNLLDRPGPGAYGSNAENLDALFADTGSAGLFGTSGDHDVAPPIYEHEGQPEAGEPGTAGADPLSAFDGEDPQGTWTLRACDAAIEDTGSVVQWSLLFYTESSTDTEPPGPLAEAYRLTPAYPNPSGRAAEVRLVLREPQAVRVAVYDGLGRRVAVLHDGLLGAGREHLLILDAGALPSGVYVVRATGERFSASQKVTVLR
ncbi:MAG: proprotein convertase P-domain-containing protein, partial [Rhodothermales bacterium]|nr:proprotein convertase P-domain-containing protein [Rhodothermales bacterium]